MEEKTFIVYESDSFDTGTGGACFLCLTNNNLILLLYTNYEGSKKINNDGGPFQ